MHSTPLYHFAYFIIGLNIVLVGLGIDHTIIKNLLLGFGGFYTSVSMFNIIDTFIQSRKNQQNK